MNNWTIAFYSVGSVGAITSLLAFKVKIDSFPLSIMNLTLRKPLLSLALVAGV
jgi:hypothetical protein